MTGREFARNILKDTNFTQQQIADCLGVDQSLISKWKTGERDLTAQQFDDLCGLLGFSLLDYIQGNVYTPISFAFSAKELTSDDVATLGKLNRMFANLKFMEALDSRETN